jgi:O-methyltransferase
MVDLSRRWRASRGHRIEKLPTPLRPAAKVIRNQLIDRTYVYRADGLATAHYCPFYDDPEFAGLYSEMVKSWVPGADTRWRMWLLSSLARQCQQLPGDFAEFGTWRGGCAYMILGRTTVPDGHRFLLFDTFTGIPADRLTEHERADAFAGRLSDTSVELVDDLLAPWKPRYELHAGDIFQTLETADVGDLSFAHIDLNTAAATRRALEFAYERLVTGGIIVLDDYGATAYPDQRLATDEFFRDLPEQPIALPTCQGFAIKR